MTEPNEVDILLVEDNPDDLELTLHALRREHLANNIFAVRDGEEAVQHTYRRLRAGLTRGRRKSDDVREEHANAIVSISDPFARLESFSHRRGENVQEERV